MTHCGHKVALHLIEQAKAGYVVQHYDGTDGNPVVPKQRHDAGHERPLLLAYLQTHDILKVLRQMRLAELQST